MSDRSAGNKLTAADMPVLCHQFRTVNASPKVIVLMLRSEGKQFCSGFDISQMASKSQIQGESFGAMVDQLENCSAITVARVQGGIYGAATDIALACDFRLGGQGANPAQNSSCQNRRRKRTRTELRSFGCVSRSIFAFMQQQVADAPSMMVSQQSLTRNSNAVGTVNAQGTAPNH